MLSKMTDSEILAKIEEQQAIQKRYNYKHAMWQQASKILHELYAEMHKRSKTQK